MDESKIYLQQSSPLAVLAFLPRSLNLKRPVPSLNFAIINTGARGWASPDCLVIHSLLSEHLPA